MLEQSTISEQSAAEVKATPMELAEAITSLEVKKAGIDGKPDTITLSEVIRQLEIDATPDELLAEVHALRSAKKQRVTALRRRTSWRLGLIAAFMISPITIWWLLRQTTAAPIATPTVASP